MLPCKSSLFAAAPKSDYIDASETTPDVHQLKFDGSNESLLPQFVKEAHSHVIFLSSLC